MIVGIDFDNTIINYDYSMTDIARFNGFIGKDWRGTKGELRDYLRSFPDGDKNWQFIQSKAYGELINQGVLADGFLEFLKLLKINNIKVVVVSHKTQFSPYSDIKIPLRKVALDWMVKNNLFIAETGLTPRSIYFEGTRTKKIELIKKLNCTLFIDDLHEVFAENSFPKFVKKILYCNVPYGFKKYDFCSKNWNEIFEYINKLRY